MSKDHKAMPLAIGPRPENKSYEQGIRAAMQGLSLAINARLEDPDNFRFNDVTRLSKIGEALGRQLARGADNVGAFIPRHRNRPYMGPYVGGYGVGNLGGVEPDEIIDEGVIEHGGPVIEPNGPWVNANPPGFGNQNDPMSAFGEMIETMKDKSETSRKLDALRELSEIRKSLSDEKTSEAERTVLEERRELLLEEITSINDKERMTRAQVAKIKALQDDVSVRCLNPDCGTAHDRDWVDGEGRPLRCDVCNGKMLLEVGPKEGQVPEHGPNGRDHDQPRGCQPLPPYPLPPEGV